MNDCNGAYTVQHNSLQNIEKINVDNIVQLQRDEKGMSYGQVTCILNEEITGLNIAKGLERYSDNEKIYLKNLRSYVCNIRSMLNAIETVSEKDLADYKIIIHGIKKASFDIFAGEIGKNAEYLEKAARNNDLSYIRKHNSTFLKAARKLIGDIEDMLSAY